MLQEAPFYTDKQRINPERAFRKALFEGRLTEDDLRFIEEYISEYQAMRHIKTHRVLKTIYDLISWRRFIARPFREMTAGDLNAALNAMQGGKSARGTPYKQNTQHDYIKALKSFVLWLIDNGNSTIKR